MSRHYFDCEHNSRRIRVTLGYDRPLLEFFLQVHELSSEDDGLLYASLADLDAMVKDIDYFRHKLRSLQIEVPETVFAAVIEDCAHCAGNKVVEHFADGRRRVVL